MTLLLLLLIIFLLLLCVKECFIEMNIMELIKMEDIKIDNIINVLFIFTMYGY